jgi:hypothetical protein
MDSQPQRPAPDEHELTRSEKALAVILAAFLLLGSLWIYSQPLDRITYPAAKSPTPAVVKQQTERQSQLEADLQAAEVAYQQALAADPESAQTEKARQQFIDAKRAVDDLNQKYAEGIPGDTQQSAKGEGVTFALRLAFVLGQLLAALAIHQRVSRKGSRRTLITLAFVVQAGVMGIVMGLDYLSDYIDWEKIGPLYLSLAGSAMVILAILAYQRMLARRLSERRALHHQCLACGQKAEDGRYCERCGSGVYESCRNCGELRRRGIPHCANCGAAQGEPK